MTSVGANSTARRHAAAHAGTEAQSTRPATPAVRGVQRMPWNRQPAPRQYKPRRRDARTKRPSLTASVSRRLRNGQLSEGLGSSSRSSSSSGGNAASLRKITAAAFWHTKQRGLRPQHYRRGRSPRRVLSTSHKMRCRRLSRVVRYGPGRPVRPGGPVDGIKRAPTSCSIAAASAAAPARRRRM